MIPLGISQCGWRPLTHKALRPAREIGIHITGEVAVRRIGVALFLGTICAFPNGSKDRKQFTTVSTQSLQIKTDIAAVLIGRSLRSEFDEGHIGIFSIRDESLQGGLNSPDLGLTLSTVGPLLTLARPIGGIVQHKQNVRQCTGRRTTGKTAREEIDIFGHCMGRAQQQPH